jgi:hypothetical protein
MGLDPQKRLRLTVGGQHLTIRRDMQRRHRQRLERAGGDGGRRRVGKIGHGVDLPPAIAGGKDDRHHVDQRLARAQPRATTGHEWQFGKHLREFLRVGAHQAAHGLIGEQDRVGMADGHHRQADPLTRMIGRARLIEAPQDATLNPPREQPHGTARRRHGFRTRFRARARDAA